MVEPVEVFELVLGGCLPAAASFQSPHKGTPSRKPNSFFQIPPDFVVKNQAIDIVEVIA